MRIHRIAIEYRGHPGLVGDHNRVDGIHHRSYPSGERRSSRGPRAGRPELYEQGHLEEAIVEYDEAIRLDPQDADAYYNRGLAYGDLFKYQGAIEDYDEAIRLEPRTFIVYYYRGIAYHALGQLERAIQDLNEAIRLDPKYALAYSARGTSYRHLGEYQRAIEDYDDAIRLDPQQRAYYHYSRALSYIYLNRDVEAGQDAERAIELGADRGILEASIEEVKRNR